MPIERRKRAEWERLLTHHHAARLEDLPDELRELLGKLDEKLGVQQSQRQEDMRAEAPEQPDTAQRATNKPQA
jgi:TolA-binding protein